MSDHTAPESTPATDDTDGAVVPGSDNVFADLGFDDPHEELLKADLVLSITDQIKRMGLSQTKAAVLMGLSQPDVSKLLRGRTGGYSLGRLLGFIRVLGRDVEISVSTPSVPREGRMSLRVSASA